jgi:hypothetical protein
MDWLWMQGKCFQELFSTPELQPGVWTRTATGYKSMANFLRMLRFANAAVLIHCAVRNF